MNTVPEETIKRHIEEGKRRREIALNVLRDAERDIQRNYDNAVVNVQQNTGWTGEPTAEQQAEIDRLREKYQHELLAIRLVRQIVNS